MGYLEKIDNAIARAEGWLLIVLLITMIGLAFLQVMLRNFFQSGINWADTFNRHLVLWVGFLGASLAAKQNRHITIDVLSRLVPEYWKKYITVIINTTGTIICGFLTNASFQFVQIEREMGAILFLNVPTWTMEIIIPIGFGMLTFRFFLHFVNFSLDSRSR